MLHLQLIDPRGRRWTIERPVTRRERARGLHGRRWMAPDQGMLFYRCRSVHTLGMTFPIAVVLLDAEMRVLAVKCVSPGRLVWPRPRVRHVLECPVDTDLRPGDLLREPAGTPPGYTLSAAP